MLSDFDLVRVFETTRSGAFSTAEISTNVDLNLDNILGQDLIPGRELWFCGHTIQGYYQDPSSNRYYTRPETIQTYYAGLLPSPADFIDWPNGQLMPFHKYEPVNAGDPRLWLKASGGQYGIRQAGVDVDADAYLFRVTVYFGLKFNKK